jgi:hypothetical protein
VAIAHGVRQDIAQSGRDQVVQRCRVLWQGQVEQFPAQGVGERLPDRPRGQRGEVVGDAACEALRNAAGSASRAALVSASLTSQA